MQLKQYKARIICTFIFLMAVVLWNSIYYFVYKYPFNPLVDISYTVLICTLVWWLAGFYDKSGILIKNLRDSEDNYKELLDSVNYVVDNLNQVVYRTDADGNFTSLNPVWETITGYTVEESIGQHIMNFVYHEDHEGTTALILKCIDDKTESLKEEIRFRKKSGGFIWVEKNIKLNYDQNGEILSSLGTITDISERKQSELEIQQYHEDLAMRSEKLSVVAQLSAAIAHEVRNPLTSISGFLQLLKERKSLKQEYIDIIFSEIDRIETVLGELLVLSKPQAVTFKKFDLTKSLEYVVTLLTTKSNMHSIEINYNRPNAAIEIFGEENRIKQVFINIIKNAIEAMPNGGLINICLIASADYVSVFITDNGPGIPTEVMDNIGQPFYTTKDKGTGLGLTTCFKIIESHEGKINITTRNGAGTTFELVLPYLPTSNHEEPISLTS